MINQRMIFDCEDVIGYINTDCRKILYNISLGNYKELEFVK